MSTDMEELLFDYIKIEAWEFCERDCEIYIFDDTGVEYVLDPDGEDVTMVQDARPKHKQQTGFTGYQGWDDEWDDYMGQRPLSGMGFGGAGYGQYTSILEDSMDAQPFQPHKPDTKVTHTHRIPTIFITPQALEDMRAIVGLCTIEISWFGTVTEFEDGDFLIEEIYLPEQECSAVETEATEEGMAKAMEMVIMAHEGDPFAVDRLRFWGHSHVNMGTSPSGQDNAQIKELAQGAPYMIRGILNKKGQMEFSIHRFDIGLTFQDVPWMPFYEQIEPDVETWTKRIQDRVQRSSYGRGATTTGNTNKRHTTKVGGAGKNFSSPSGAQPLLVKGDV